VKSEFIEAGRGPAVASGEPLARRVFSRRAAVLLVRNTVVSSLAFAVGLAGLWVMVERLAISKVAAGALSFVVATSLHYAFGRSFVYRGTDRAVGRGYVYFLGNGLIGLAITVVLFAALLRWTPMHYMVARLLVSVLAGLVMFLLNAVLNFKRL
jgi:putative flippase GtrA